MSEGDPDNVVALRRDETSIGGQPPSGGDSGGPDGDGTAGERLAALEVHANVIREEIRDHVATKNDLSGLKAWIAISALAVVMAVTLIVSRMLEGG